MKLAISNIAWERHEDEAVASVMKRLGVTGVEIAPTKVWPSPLTASEADALAYRRWWEDRGIRIVAMQSLLFGRPDLVIFGDEYVRAETFEYLAGMIRLGGWLGARALVFGSPKNRQVGGLPEEEVDRIAVPFFRGLGDLAASCGTCLCIEPNPTAYACDFLTTSGDALAFVERVGNDGVGLHLDVAGMTLSGEPVDRAIARAAGAIRHFHASEAFLDAIGAGTVDHARFSAALAGVPYRNWVSIEMRGGNDGRNVARVETALASVLLQYHSVLSLP